MPKICGGAIGSAGAVVCSIPTERHHEPEDQINDDPGKGHAGDRDDHIEQPNQGRRPAEPLGETAADAGDPTVVAGAVERHLAGLSGESAATPVTGEEVDDGSDAVDEDEDEDPDELLIVGQVFPPEALDQHPDPEGEGEEADRAAEEHGEQTDDGGGG